MWKWNQTFVTRADIHIYGPRSLICEKYQTDQVITETLVKHKLITYNYYATTKTSWKGSWRKLNVTWTHGKETPKIETSAKELLRSQWPESKKVGWKSIKDDDNHAMDPLNRTYSVISADPALFRTQEERRIYERTNVGNEKEQPLTSHRPQSS
jgi:hypothetical protein